MKKIIVTTAVTVFSMAIIAYAAPDSNSIVKDDIEYYMQTDKSVYNLGEEVQILYRVTNLRNEDVTFRFCSGCQHLFMVKYNNDVIWSAPTYCTMAFTEFELQPGDSKEFHLPPWDTSMASSGNYEVIGSLAYPPSHERYVPVSLQIEIIPPPAITYYVNATEGSDDNDGLSPETAFATIQKAIGSAFDGDTVEVWPGTYTGPGNQDIDPNGKNLTIRSIDPNDPNIVTATIIDCNGTETEPHRGFYFGSGEDANSVLNGLTITKGCSAFGGGIYCENSSPKISNCIITNSYAIGYGGGMFNCENSWPTLINCTFISNRSSYDGRGGAMVNDGSSPTLLRCSFIANRGGNSAGAIQNTDSNAVLTNCTFTGNFAPIVCVCYTGGGAIHNRRGSPVLTNCAFTGNYAPFGGAVFNNESTPKIINCTFSDNFRAAGGNAICNLGDTCNPTVRNCILWNLWDYSDNEILNLLGATVNTTYSNVQGGWPGLGNIDMDPCFVGPAGYRHDNNTPADWTDDFWVDGDYHLLADSPCIDAGDPCYIAEPNETDIDGNLRIIGGRIDMGAYEFAEPVGLLDFLAQDIIDLQLQQGLENSLLSKLNAALQKLEDDNENNDNAAINLLEAFINAVEAQRGKKIPEADADALIAAAQEITDLLSE